MTSAWLLVALLASGLVRAEAPPAPAVIGETLWLAREASVLTDATPATAAQRLPALLKQHFSLNLTCGKGQALNPSAPRCLIGARQIARAFYRGRLKSLDPSVAEVFSVNVTDESYVHVSLTESQVRVNLPYTTPPDEVTRHVARVLKTRLVRERIALMAEHKKILDTWNDLGLMELDIDPGLSLADQKHVVNVLLDLAAEDETLFDRPSEVFFVTTRFRAVFERRLRLEEAIRADASAEDIKRFLRQTKTDTAGIAAIQMRVQTLRERIRVAGEELERTLKVKYDCSDESWLTLHACAHTLERLVKFNTRVGGLAVDAKMVLIVAQTDMLEDANVFQSMQDKELYGILALRDGFDFGRLKTFARGRGWIP